MSRMSMPRRALVAVAVTALAALTAYAVAATAATLSSDVLVMGSFDGNYLARKGNESLLDFSRPSDRVVPVGFQDGGRIVVSSEGVDEFGLRGVHVRFCGIFTIEGDDSELLAQLSVVIGESSAPFRVGTRSKHSVSSGLRQSEGYRCVEGVLGALPGRHRVKVTVQATSEGSSLLWITDYTLLVTS